MTILNDEEWQRLLPKLRERCPRLTPEDLTSCEQRSDLLESRIQNRQWISRDDAKRIVLQLLSEIGFLAKA